MVNFKGADFDVRAPYGGSKMLGDRRGFGGRDFERLLEIAAPFGHSAS